jgi:hypothetical protein
MVQSEFLCTAMVQQPPKLVLVLSFTASKTKQSIIG